MYIMGKEACSGVMEMVSADGAFEAVEFRSRDGDSPILIVCEHASNFIPPEFEGLGLSQSLLESHIAWDPGAAHVATELSEILNAQCVLGKVSRLVYDCNRPPEAHDAMPARSEIYDIPGNLNLGNDDRIFRIQNIYEPFQDCLEKAAARSSALITIHSFTPVYNGISRDVEIGVLHDQDAALAEAMMMSCREFTNHVVKRNEPYGPEHGVTHTLKKHGLENAIPNVMIEIRNDLIETEVACQKMAEMLAGLISTSLQTLLSTQQKLGKHA